MLIESNNSPSDRTTEYHAPFHNYLGPGTHISDKINKSVLPINTLDKAAMIHDIEYLANNKFKADNNMWLNIIREKPYLLPLANLVRIGLLFRPLLPMEFKPDYKEYHRLKKIAEKTQNLNRMQFESYDLVDDYIK